MRYLITLSVLLFAASAFAADVVYVSVAGEKRIEIYGIDGSGGLMKAGAIATTGEPGALVADPKRRFLFAAFRSTGELASFQIDPATGKLTHLNTVPAGADPAHISVDKSGKFLFTAYYVAGQVTVYAIAADGSLGQKPTQTVKTKEKAHAVVLNTSERKVLVPHTGPNVIYAFDWSAETGEIKRSTAIETPMSTGPRHLVFHPTLEINGVERVAYVVNEQGGSVTLYRESLGEWRFEPKQTLSTLPANFKGTNACAEIHLHPSNRFLYVSNRGHDSIAGFRIAKETGELTSLGQTPTEKTPRSFDIDPSGKLLYAAGES
jgi:6-phosphogluconolactonase